MPQIENVTQIKLRMPQGGHPNGVKHEREKGCNEGVQAPLSKGIEEREEALLDEFTRLTGYHRKSAARLLGAKPVKQVMVYGDGKAVKIKPEKKRPSKGITCKKSE